ncbi:hypothetical protein B296_00043109, partial [Ensete ventricosum]
SLGDVYSQLTFFILPAPSLKLIDLPGLDQRSMDDSRVSCYLQFYYKVSARLFRMSCLGSVNKWCRVQKVPGLLPWSFVENLRISFCSTLPLGRSVIDIFVCSLGFIILCSDSCICRVHRVLLDIVSTSVNATPGLGRYPPFKREVKLVVAIASTALENFRNEAKKMVVALVDMERAFVPPQHFIRLVQRSTIYTLQECNLEEVTDEDDPPKSSKDSKKAKGPEKGPSLIFKLTSKVAYKTVLKAHSAVVLKAENMADKVEWMNKIRNMTGPSKGVPDSVATPTIRQSRSDGSLVSLS